MVENKAAGDAFANIGHHTGGVEGENTDLRRLTNVFVAYMSFNKVELRMISGFSNSLYLCFKS